MNAAKSAANDIRESLVSKAQEFIKTLERDLESAGRIWMSQNHVVMNAGFCIRFDISSGVCTNPVSHGGSAFNAQRFVKEDAEMLAMLCVNGAGENAQAVSVVDALKAQIEGQKWLLSTLAEIDPENSL